MEGTEPSSSGESNPTPTSSSSSPSSTPSSTFSAESLEGEMRELMKEGRVDTGIVLKRLKVEDADVMCVYLIGSRLWGSASDGSDWDFEIVHRSWKEGSGRSSLHNGELDASMIDKREFSRRIEEEHHFYETLCLWLPEEYVWREHPEISDMRRKNGFHPNPNKWLNAVQEETTRDWRMAQKYMEKGNVERGRKTIVHAFRLLITAAKIIECKEGKLKLHDFYDAHKYWLEMQSHESVDWSFYAAEYRPEYDRLQALFKEACEKVAAMSKAKTRTVAAEVRAKRPPMARPAAKGSTKPSPAADNKGEGTAKEGEKGNTKKEKEEQPGTNKGPNAAERKGNGKGTGGRGRRNK